MEIHTRKERHAVVVSLKGRADAMTSPELEERLADLIAQGEDTLVLVCDGLVYISSAGLRSLLVAAKKLKEKQGKIFLAGLQGPVREVFEISGFSSLFKIFDSEEAALEAI